MRRRYFKRKSCEMRELASLLLGALPAVWKAFIPLSYKKNQENLTNKHRTIDKMPSFAIVPAHKPHS